MRDVCCHWVLIVPTPVGVNREEAVWLGVRDDCPHARGGEPER